MKKVFGTVILIIIAGIAFHHYHERTVSYELEAVLQKPDSLMDLSDFNGFYYAGDEKSLLHGLTSFCEKQGAVGYDRNKIEELGKQLDFEQHDYLITFQKRLEKLSHSPHLSHTEDLLCDDHRTPLIPTLSNEPTDSIYIYRIAKNNKYRAPGP